MAAGGTGGPGAAAQQREVPREDLRRELGSWLSAVFDRPVEVTGVTRLAGGASQEAWGFECLGQRLVLRRDLGGMIYDYGVDRQGEYRVLDAAHRAGVQVPRPLAYSPSLAGRPAFVMERLDGEAIGRRVVSDTRYAGVRPLLVQQLMDNLAAVHRLDVSTLPFLPRPARGEPPAVQELDRMQGQLDDVGEPHPALELGLRWLRRRAPVEEELRVVHGDFRTGNYLVTPQDGLTGVLDWEYVHLGHPVEDLGWFCVRAWRFGADGLAGGGLVDREGLLQAYEKASGQPVEPELLTWWELFGNVRWAVGALAQAQRHLTGVEQSIELASLGRICAEMELEVLRMLDEVHR